ncbi:MAG: cysteine--tRNA ligase [Planctomycetota bacterium]
MAIRVYNTLTHAKEEFRPVHPGKVGIYLCGPTVYMNSHLGHAVGPLFFDTVRRYLTDRGYAVTLVHNITDIDDKIIDRAAREGLEWRRLTEEVTENYLATMSALGFVNVDHLPRATEHIEEIIELIQTLIRKRFAYEVDGDVYFDIGTAKDYGKLSGRKPEELLAGARVAVDDRKRNEGDFALWKSAKPGEPSWPSPWGPGRPGWHIECSAMSMKYLGESFDIHGGGNDLIFPHHENEILQSESSTGKPFARYWMHNGLTTVDGQKMSKSLGNVVELTDLLRRYPSELVRFFILRTHYRSTLNFSHELLEESKKAFSAFQRFLERVERATGVDVYVASTDSADPSAARPLAGELRGASDAFYEAMDDDFNTARAIATLFDLVAALNRKADELGLDATREDALKKDFLRAAALLRRLAGILGLLEHRPVESAGAESPSDEEIDRLLRERDEARRKKDYRRSDEIRAGLAEKGIVLEDRPQGTIWRRA